MSATPKVWTDAEKEEYHAQAHREIQMEGVKGALIVGLLGNAALLGANQVWPTYRNLNWRGKWFLSSVMPVIGFAVWGDEATVRTARNAPWIKDEYLSSRLSSRD